MSVNAVSHNSMQDLRWTGPMVWNAQDFNDDSWAVQLSTQEITVIRKAVERTMLAGKQIGELTARDFDFESFSERLLLLRDDILDGCGFIVLRGLNDDSWTDEQLLRAYWGIGTVLGDPVSQNARAHLLGHVIDQRAAEQANTRIYQTSKAQPFHSDSCDTVGLLCLRQAKSGGESSIASSARVYNDLLENAPHALETLKGEFLCDRYGEIPEGKLPYYSLRVFNEVAGKLVCCGMDHDIRSAQRLNGVPALSADQVNALDTFQHTARKQALNMMLERGDMQWVNNHVVVHAREQFEDYNDPHKRRYLARLWLSAPKGRELPEFLRERWGNIEPGSIRGGIRVPGATPVVNVDPYA